jgi:hypothetical protein
MQPLGDVIADRVLVEHAENERFFAGEKTHISSANMQIGRRRLYTDGAAVTIGVEI